MDSCGLLKHLILALAGLPLAVAMGVADRPAPATAAAKGSVSLSIEPLQARYFDQPVVFKFGYTAAVEQVAGTAEVKMDNRDTGKSVSKSFSIELTPGSHQAQAAWGAAGLHNGVLRDRPADEVQKTVRLDALENDLDLTAADDLLGKINGESSAEELPDGLYVPSVTLRSAAGETLAVFQPPAGDIQSLLATGQAFHKLGKATTEAKAAEMRVWLDELTSLEAKAREAGADTSVPHLLVAALRETVKHAPRFLAARQYDVVADNHSYVRVQALKTRKQLEGLILSPQSGLKAGAVPRPQDRLRCKNGYFYAGDKPVFAAGVHLFSLWLDELPVVRELGYTAIHVSAASRSVFPEADSAAGELRLGDLAGPPENNASVRALLDRCAELGLKVNLTLTSNPPDWFFVKHPAAKLRGGSAERKLRYDIEDPDALQWIERYYDAAMPQIAGHKALNSICLADEPTLLNLGARSAALFREHVQGKYGTVEKLNGAWCTDYASFADIRIDRSPRTAMSASAQLEFWWFNLGRLTRHLEWLSSLVRKHDPDLPVTFKLNDTPLGLPCPVPDVAREAVADLGQVAGFGAGMRLSDKPFADLLRSLSPDKPLVNLELPNGASRIRLDFWKGALSFGLAGFDAGCWYPRPGFWPSRGHAPTLHAGALAVSDIQRLLPQVMAFNPFPRSPFVVLQPDPVLPRAEACFGTQASAVTALNLAGYATDYVTEKLVAEGRLERHAYKVMVLASADFITDATFKKVEALVRNGGVAVVLGAAPAHDERGRPRDLGGFKAPADARPAFGETSGGVVFPCGAGEVWMLPAGDVKTLQGSLEAIAAQKLPPQPVAIRGLENRTIPWKNARGEDVYLTYVFNEEPFDQQTVEPRFHVRMKGGTDLITGERVAAGAFSVPAQDVRLIEWIPEERR